MFKQFRNNLLKRIFFSEFVSQIIKSITKASFSLLLILLVPHKGRRMFAERNDEKKEESENVLA